MGKKWLIPSITSPKPAAMSINTKVAIMVLDTLSSFAAFGVENQAVKA